MLAAALIALALAAEPPEGSDQTPELPPAPDEAPAFKETVYRLRLSGWGGAGFLFDGNAPAPMAAVEVAFPFEWMDVGLIGQLHRFGFASGTLYVPSALVRLEQRFETRRGLDAILAFGVGAGKLDTWGLWYHAALGLRWTDGALVYGFEAGYEQSALLRVAVHVGYRL